MSEQQINDGGPAFPNESDSIANPDGGLIKLRDYGLQGHPGMEPDDSNPIGVAELALEFADALIAALNERPQS